MNVNWKIFETLTVRYGESFYLLDSNKFEQNYDDFLGAFREIYPKTFIAYSYKTNYIPKLCSIINDKGGYAEVVSEMEYDLAIKIGVLPQNIIVNGPYKNKKSLEKFLLKGSLVNLDSFTEAAFVEQIANENLNNDLSVGFRCNFEIDDSLISRFGFDVNNKRFNDIFYKLQKIENITVKGLHCHFPNRDIDSYKSRVNKMLQLENKLFSNPPDYVNIGGGYFGKMEISLEKQFNCKAPKYPEYAEVIATKCRTFYKNINDDLKPKLFLEPGSAIVADTMKFVAKVIDIKNIRGKNIATTTGSKLNIGLLSSKINLPMKVYSSSAEKLNDKNYYNDIEISGYTCVEGDYLYRNYNGSLKIGDFVVFDNVGSYSFLFKPPFILPNVAIIDYDFQNNTYDVVKRKENMNDIFKTFIF